MWRKIDVENKMENGKVMEAVSEKKEGNHSKEELGWAHRYSYKDLCGT